jgi:hypothetical protein
MREPGSGKVRTCVQAASVHPGAGRYTYVPAAGTGSGFSGMVAAPSGPHHRLMSRAAPVSAVTDLSPATITSALAVTAMMVTALERGQVNPYLATTAPDLASCHIPAEVVERALRVVHEAFSPYYDAAPVPAAPAQAAPVSAAPVSAGARVGCAGWAWLSGARRPIEPSFPPG